MYNKIFTKILDSSIWLEPSPTRIVWVTLIAAMDENGFAAFASVANLGHRAIVTPKEAKEAVTTLENPDSNSADPDNEGRRIERVPGGWMILNAEKYRDIVTRSMVQEQTRARVARHREKKKRNATVTECNDFVTPSEAYTEAEVQSKDNIVRNGFSLDMESNSKVSPAELLDHANEIYQAYPKHVAKPSAIKAILKALKKESHAKLLFLTQNYSKVRNGILDFVPHPATWFNQERYNDDPSTWKPKSTPSRFDNNQEPELMPSQQEQRRK